MKYVIVIINCLILICSQSTAEENPRLKSAELLGGAQFPISVDKDNENAHYYSTAPGDLTIVIHYGLNDSHSGNWVQEDANGVIGISYFQRFEGNYTDGTLIYKIIQPNGYSELDSVTTGTRLEKSVLLFDASSNPHIFLARSNNDNQWIEHYHKDGRDVWQNEIIYNFYNTGGKFIYELSADTGPDGSFHLLILKTRSDIDSDDYNWAWLDSYLYHLTNAPGDWTIELVRHFNMGWTYDTYVKSSCRQDIKVDADGFVHVIFREQLYNGDFPSRLWYATNEGGSWTYEIALSYDYGNRDDAGWFPSLCLDNNGTPYISCTYIGRVYTYSAKYCKLLLLKRLGSNYWQTDTIAEHDDGYYGADGRNYTGALSRLVFDELNRPHVIFTDIASTHWPTLNQCWNIGNIRHAVLENGVWNTTTIYHQPLPAYFYNATEMHGMCLVISDLTDSIRVIGEEMVITGEFQYTSTLVDVSWASIPTDVEDDSRNLLPQEYSLSQNYPNPFNPETTIEYNIPTRSHVTIEVYNILGQKTRTLVDELKSAGDFQITWDGNDSNGTKVSTGIYFYRIKANDFVKSRKMLLLK